MKDQPYTIVLEERQSNFFEVTSPELPKFHAEVTGSYVDEALCRAKPLLAAWIARQEELGEHLPPGRGRGYIIYGDGVKKTAEDLLWGKAEIRRYTGLSRATIDRRIKDGTLKPVKVGRRVLFQAWQVKSALTSTKIPLPPLD